MKLLVYPRLQSNSIYVTHSKILEDLIERKKSVLAIYLSGRAKAKLSMRKYKNASCNGLVLYDQWLHYYKQSTKHAFEHLQYCFTATYSKTFQIISFTENCLALIEKSSWVHCSQYNPLASNIKERSNDSELLQSQKRWSFPDPLQMGSLLCWRRPFCSLLLHWLRDWKDKLKLTNVT